MYLLVKQAHRTFYLITEIHVIPSLYPSAHLPTNHSLPILQLQPFNSSQLSSCHGSLLNLIPKHPQASPGHLILPVHFFPSSSVPAHLESPLLPPLSAPGKTPRIWACCTNISPDTSCWLVMMVQLPATTKRQRSIYAQTNKQSNVFCCLLSHLQPGLTDSESQRDISKGDWICNCYCNVSSHPDCHCSPMQKQGLSSSAIHTAQTLWCWCQWRTDHIPGPTKSGWALPACTSCRCLTPCQNPPT